MYKIDVTFKDDILKLWVKSLKDYGLYSNRQVRRVLKTILRQFGNCFNIVQIDTLPFLNLICINGFKVNNKTFIEIKSNFLISVNKLMIEHDIPKKLLLNEFYSRLPLVRELGDNKKFIEELMIKQIDCALIDFVNDGLSYYPKMVISYTSSNTITNLISYKGVNQSDLYVINRNLRAIFNSINLIKI